MAEDAIPTLQRVKLYVLNAERQWVDRGTGFVSLVFKTALNGHSLLVREENDGDLLLDDKIQLDTIYQKQQDTMIVWSDAENFELALSFQESAGCDEIWRKICRVQGKDPSCDSTQDLTIDWNGDESEDTPYASPELKLPPCDLEHLKDINEMISSNSKIQLRDKLAVALEQGNYIKQLRKIFRVCEGLGDQNGLRNLYEIFCNIFFLNRASLFEIMFAKDAIIDVIGCLEYDPSGGPPKRHRHYLQQQSRFREPIKIKNPILLAKIHQTYRIQYIQDIALPPSPAFDTSMLSTLSFIISFYKREIVIMIQEDDNFLNDLFVLLSDIKAPLDQRRDAILILKELFSFAQQLQPTGKQAFNNNLIRLGLILPALEIGLNTPDSVVKSASINVLTRMAEFSPTFVRDYALSQYNNNKDDLINVAVEQILNDAADMGIGDQVVRFLKLLLDPDNMGLCGNKTEFLDFFYATPMQALIVPFIASTQHSTPRYDDSHSAHLLGLILELLLYCVEHHSSHAKLCIREKDLLRRALVLMRSTHGFLVLTALRFMRKIISMRDDAYNRYIIEEKFFAPVVDAFIRNNNRHNLLESAILELFEFIMLQDVEILHTHVVEVFESVKHIPTFMELKIKYGHHKDRVKVPEKRPALVPLILMNNSRFLRVHQRPKKESVAFNEEDGLENAVQIEIDQENQADMKHEPKPHPWSHLQVGTQEAVSQVFDSISEAAKALAAALDEETETEPDEITQEVNGDHQQQAEITQGRVNGVQQQQADLQERSSHEETTIIGRADEVNSTEKEEGFKKSLIYYEFGDSYEDEEMEGKPVVV